MSFVMFPVGLTDEAAAGATVPRSRFGTHGVSWNTFCCLIRSPDPMDPAPVTGTRANRY